MPVRNAYAAPLPPRRRLRATCQVHLDVRHLSDEAMARAVQSLADAPDGAVARIVIAPGQLPPAVALDYLGRYGNLGRVIFAGDPATVRTWWETLNAPW